MNKEQRIIKKVLSHFSNSREAQHYLKRFNSDELKFAVVKVGGGIVADELTALAESLAMLSQMGLTPIIIHGGGVQIETAMEKAGIQTVKKDGLRVTSDEDITLIQSVMAEINQSIVDSLGQLEVSAKGFNQGVFVCDLIDKNKYGAVGEVSSVQLDELKTCLAKGVIPVLSCLGSLSAEPADSVDLGDQAVNINADAATRALVYAIKPHKTLFVTPTGGLLNGQNQIISAIQLRHDYDQLMAQDWLHSGMKLKLQQINALLSVMDEGHSVSITSCQNLVKELFTHKGAGTYISMGEEITQSDDFEAVGDEQLNAIFERSFGRQLKANWSQDLDTLSVYVAASGRGAAVICKGHNDMPYLHKFAVTPEAQGEGLAASLWQAIKDSHPTLYWRSRQNNDINAWYHKKADFSVKQVAGEWVGFAYGIEIPLAIECTNQAFLTDPGWVHETENDESKETEVKHA